MSRTREITKKIEEIAARSAAFQQRVHSGPNDTINQELILARAVDNEADTSEPGIQPLLREEARAHHERAQSVAAQRFSETLADEILERFEQMLRMQLMIYDRGGDDTDRLLQMSSDRWEWYLHLKRIDYGSKLVAQAIELAGI